MDAEHCQSRENLSDVRDEVELSRMRLDLALTEQGRSKYSYSKQPLAKFSNLRLELKVKQCEMG
jgi:hypothetical protein